MHEIANGFDVPGCELGQLVPNEALQHTESRVLLKKRLELAEFSHGSSLFAFAFVLFKFGRPWR